MNKYCLIFLFIFLLGCEEPLKGKEIAYNIKDCPDLIRGNTPVQLVSYCINNGVVYFKK